jgi:hypothetical protein
MQAARTPAQWFALIAGIFLVALGVLSLIFGATSFAGAGSADTDTFLIWQTTGWNAVAWIATGAIGIFVAARYEAARTYALAVGVLYAAAAVWGFIDGSSVAGLFSVDTTDNITHAIVGGLGLVLGLAPDRVHQAAGIGTTASPRA